MSLPFTYEVLLSFIASMNASLWPLHLVAILYAVIMMITLRYTGRISNVIFSALIALPMFSIALIYFNQMQAINFLSVYFSYGFIASGIVIFIMYACGKLGLGNRTGRLMSVIIAFILYPAVIVILDDNLESIRMPLITPVATCLLIAGLILSSIGHWVWKATALTIPIIYLGMAAYMMAFLL